MIKKALLAGCLLMATLPMGGCVTNADGSLNLDGSVTQLWSQLKGDFGVVSADVKTADVGAANFVCEQYTLAIVPWQTLVATGKLGTDATNKGTAAFAALKTGCSAYPFTTLTGTASAAISAWAAFIAIANPNGLTLPSAPAS